MLIIGLAGLSQMSALANTKTLKMLSQLHTESLRLNSVRELSRPQVAGLALDESFSVLQVISTFQEQDFEFLVTKKDDEFAISIVAKKP